ADCGEWRDRRANPRLPPDTTMSLQPPATIHLDGNSLKLEDIGRIAAGAEIPVALAPAAVEGVRRSRAAVEELLRRGEVAYGITTGFGAFARTLIAPEQAAALQRNILVSH